VAMPPTGIRSTARSQDRYGGGITQRAYGSISQSVHTTSQIGAGSAPVTPPHSVGIRPTARPCGRPYSQPHSRCGQHPWSNAVAYGSNGSGVGQFQTIAAWPGRNQAHLRHRFGARRLVRINDLTGADWVQFGSSGSVRISSTRQLESPLTLPAKSGWPIPETTVSCASMT